MSTPEHSGYLPIGTRIGEYEITGILGQGGFGITYKAWDHTLQCDVAIKEYFPKHLASRDNDTVNIRTTVAGDLSAYRGGLESFVKEARILAKFLHSAIVPVKRLVQANNSAYMIMGFVEGQSLSEYLHAHSNRVESDTLQDWTNQLISGLAVVHAEGLLHRDIKPGNVYVKSNGEVMLLDFGAARHAAGEASMTVTGLVSGGYSPPEQYSERTTNQGTWTDIYSLSATLYRCITGVKPAASPDRQDSINDDEGDLLETLSSATYPEYPDNFLAAVNQGLSIRRKQRLQSVEAFEALISSPTPTKTQTQSAARQERVTNPPAQESPHAAVKISKVSQPQEQAHQSATIAPQSPANNNTAKVLVSLAVLILAISAIGFQQGWFDTVVGEPGNNDLEVVQDDTSPDVEVELPVLRDVSIQITPSNGYQLALVDGRRVDLNSSLQLVDGRYKLETIGRNDYQSLSGEIIVSSSQTRFSFELVANTAPLWISTNVSGVRVVLPDEPAGVTYFDGIELAKTTHRIRLIAVGYEPLNTTVDLSEKSRWSFTLASSQTTLAQLGITLADIPAGSFRMGDLTGNGYENEKPVHAVSVSGFKLMTTEVTWNHYQPCIDAGVCANPVDKRWGRGDRPVINVSWDDAQTYINWLEEDTGLSWRLPSEAEWEYAARAGTTTDYNWNSNSIAANQANYYESGNSKTVEVGRYSANRWGLYDMHGNVWEWTQDCWNASYQGAPSNGSAWELGDCSKRVFRGGSYFGYSMASTSRSSNRGRGNAAGRVNGLGFRLVQGQ
ncbi:MAG: bifunctional serine/threonine-protein kinase/formylglycine-generating enzyme family protein [Pseudomonadales bacterium]|jgi:formylglycine-generating enzyme required for sulfatase activity/serine/threonine protein kinase